MLRITIPATEQWDEGKQEFINTEETMLELEHSLVSLSKWESKWKKPFLTKPEDITNEESLDYIKCMTLNKVDDEVYNNIPQTIMNKIKDYINDPMTATWFNEDVKKKTSSKQVTNELIYCWMINMNIPFDCEEWHLNRLLTLIEVCSRENQPPKKMGKKEAMSKQAALNAARRKKLNTRG